MTRLLNDIGIKTVHEFANTDSDLIPEIYRSTLDDYTDYHEGEVSGWSGPLLDELDNRDTKVIAQVRHPLDTISSWLRRDLLNYRWFAKAYIDSFYPEALEADTDADVVALLWSKWASEIVSRGYWTYQIERVEDRWLSILWQLGYPYDRPNFEGIGRNSSHGGTRVELSELHPSNQLLVTHFGAILGYEMKD